MDNEYYGLPTTPNDTFLMHYGIKGMKWGVRKARESGNERALGRQYRKAQKKLAKLEKRAANGRKYAKRAAALGAGAAIAGGLAAAGTEGIQKGIRYAGLGLSKTIPGVSKGMIAVGKATRNSPIAALRAPGRRLYNKGLALRDTGVENLHNATKSAATAVSDWGKSNSIAAGAATKYAQMQNRAALKGITDPLAARSQALGNIKAKTNAVSGISNNALARIGAGAIGAGLAGAAGYNAYRAATTKRAAKKAAQFRSEMNKAFAGTKYASGGKRKRRR